MGTRGGEKTGMNHLGTSHTGIYEPIFLASNGGTRFDTTVTEGLDILRNREAAKDQ